MKLSTTMMIQENLLPTSKRAFTLAEVLITLSILGVVAALTIPTLVNRQSDLAAQTKIKKAISAYEDMAAIYMAESEATSLSELTCKDLGNYFKTVNSSNGGCTFTTADGVQWVFKGEAEGDAVGNVIVYDTEIAKSPRYAVVMWANAGEVNGTGKNNSDEERGPAANTIPDGAPAANKPLHGYYDANTFLNAKSSDLQAGTGSKDAPGSVKGIVGAAGGGA